LRNETKTVLDSISRFLPGHPGLIANVTGYTDNVGKKDLNLRLSEYRARVVVNYLKQKGIPENQILFTWKGSESPAASNDTEENKVKNRRVEIRFLEQ
jgi:outer membrane protein OmpA-like peptidoglycan-associated protein